MALYFTASQSFQGDVSVFSLLMQHLCGEKLFRERRFPSQLSQLLFSECLDENKVDCAYSGCLPLTA